MNRFALHWPRSLRAPGRPDKTPAASRAAGQRTTSTSSTQALTSATTSEKAIPGTSQYSPPPAPASNDTPATTIGMVAARVTTTDRTGTNRGWSGMGARSARIQMPVLARQDLVDQVVDDVPVVAGDAGHEAGDVVAPLHRQRGQLERGNPALGASLQRCHVRCAQVEAHDVVEIGGGLVGREPQIARSDLDELATST